MTTEPASTPTQTCPTCGTRLSINATRCLVCGTDLSSAGQAAGAARRARSQRAVQGSRMPEVTLSLPLVVGLMAIFLLVGGGLTFFGLRQVGSIASATEVPTATITPSPTLTPTPETPTPSWTPQPTLTPVSYEVKEGDTCISIASIFQVSIRSIVVENNLAADCPLSVGQVLNVPQPTLTPTPLATSTLSSGEATIQACETLDHVVQENETLSLISVSYGVPEEAIQEWNGLTTDGVFLGQRLSIPLCERTFVAGATVTPSPAPPYPAPELLLPDNGVAFSLADDAVSLQWSSVGALRENEAYQVTIIDITAGDNTKLVSQVPDTSFTVPETFRPNSPNPHIFEWLVEPVAQIGVDEDGNPTWRSGGPVSVTRVFTWSGAAPQSTPTP